MADIVVLSAVQEGLGRLTKAVTFDVKTLESLRGEKGPDEGKVFNLVRGLNQEMDENPETAPVLQSLKDRARFAAHLCDIRFFAVSSKPLYCRV